MRILVTDDDPNICSLLSRLFLKEGFEVVVKNSPLEALNSFGENPCDIVVTDFYMPGMNGLELLEKVKAISPGTDVIVMTAFASIDNAVEAMRKGAYDYIVKPFQNDDIILSLKRVVEKRRLAEEIKRLREELSEKYSFHNIVGVSVRMQELFEIIKKVSDSDATVLLLGESGTGKELVSRAIHFSGKRKDTRFVAVNCSALPDTLLESELFGHVKGAFTGAVENKQGLFEYASKGTLFLDEIADTSPPVQAKILRVMEDKKIRRLGDNREIEVDVRIITATSRNLKKLIEDNVFREDLFYRINVFPVNIPPLRDRKEDVPLLIEDFLMSRKLLHPSALDALMKYDWPGNVRELQNMIERLVVFSSSDTIMPEDLPSELQGVICRKIETDVLYSEARKRTLDDFNRSFINNALKMTEGNVTKAAERLGLDRANLQRLMRKHGISSAEYK